MFPVYYYFLSEDHNPSVCVSFEDLMRLVTQYASEGKLFSVFTSYSDPKDYPQWPCGANALQPEVTLSVRVRWLRLKRPGRHGNGAGLVSWHVIPAGSHHTVCGDYIFRDRGCSDEGNSFSHNWPDIPNMGSVPVLLDCRLLGGLGGRSWRAICQRVPEPSPTVTAPGGIFQ